MPIHIINKALVLITLTLVGCQKDMPSMDPATEPETGLLTDQMIESGGLSREYHLYIPEEYSASPVVILLHGNGSNHNDILGISNVKAPHKIWRTIAKENNLILLAPNGTLGNNNKRGWNDCRADAEGNPTVDDVSFISDLLDSLSVRYNYDPKKVYVSGISNGGHLAFRLAQEIPERITAFASIVASITANSTCSNSIMPVSALFMNGTADPFLPYFGGEMDSDRGNVLSTKATVEYWIQRNNTKLDPETTIIADNDPFDKSTAIKNTYKKGTNNTEVVHYEITGGGHTEPSIQERYSQIFLLLAGNQNGDFEMADAVWDFFKTKSK